MRPGIASLFFAALSLTSFTALGVGCGSSAGDGSGAGTDGGSGGGDGGSGGADSDGGGGGGSAPQFSELWYAVDDKLVYIPIDKATAEVGAFVVSQIEGLEIGQNSISMLDDGSLLGARLASSDNQSYFFLISNPPRDGSPVMPVDMGIMPDGIMVEVHRNPAEAWSDGAQSLNFQQFQEMIPKVAAVKGEVEVVMDGSRRG